MRFATGAVLVPHGVQKIILGSAVNLAPFIDKQMGLPNPLMWAYFAIFAEFLCGLSRDRTFHSPGSVDHLDRDGHHCFLFNGNLATSGPSRAMNTPCCGRCSA